MKLSAYTIATNCTDLTDIKAGISELNEYFKKTLKPTNTAYIRLYKLNLKLQKFENK